MDNQEKDDLIATLRAALAELVAKLDAIAADPSYKQQCSIAWAHGHRYEGPQWTAELEIARALATKEPQPAAKEGT